MLLAMVVVGSVLAVGTVHVSVFLVMAPLALLAGVFALWNAEPGRSAIPAPSVILGLLAAWSALQAVPVPAAWLARIAPRNVEVWADAFRPFGEGSPAWVPISVDPGASLVEALKWLSYGAVFAAAAFLGRTRSRQTGVMIVFGAALAAAAVTIGHGLVGATKLYGIYQPSFSKSQWGLSPLLNPNSFSGYLNLGVFAGLGLLVTRHAAAPRWLIGLGVAVILGVSFSAASRAGWASLAVGILVLAVSVGRVLRKAPGSAGGRLVLWTELGAVALLAVVLFVLGASTAVIQELLDTNVAKFTVFEWTRPLIKQHLWFGVGRGGFETAFPAFRQGTGHIIYEHAENFVIQWCAEWGVPAAAVALLALFFLLRPRRLSAHRDVVAASALVGALVLLLHNLVDLALEIPSVPIALFTLLGSVWGGSSATGPKRDETSDLADPERGSSRAPALLLALIGMAAFFGAIVYGTHPAHDDRQRLSKQLENLRKGTPAAHIPFRTELRQAIGRHPGDPFLPFLGALAAYRLHQNALPWIGRAIEREPMGGRPYLLLARVLGDRRAADQAVLSLRMALDREFALISEISDLAVRVAPDARLRRLVPDGSAGVDVLWQLAARLDRPEQRVLREQLLDEALQRNPKFTAPHIFRANQWLEELTRNTADGPCSGGAHDQCLHRVEEEARRLAKIDAQSAKPLIFQARVLLMRGKPDSADRLLASGCDKFASPECLQWRATAAASTKSAEDLQPAIRTYLAASCSTAATCAQAARWAGDLYAGRGDWAGAVALYERWARESESPEAWLKLAEAANRAGFYTRAARAAEHARQAGASGAEDIVKSVERARRDELLRMTR